MTDWEAALTTALQALEGVIASDVWVREMAFYGREDAGCFADPTLAFVQGNVLELRTSGGETFHFSCHQDDDSWALWVGTVPSSRHLAPDIGEGWFRVRPLPEFPRGRVDKVQVAASLSNIQEIRIVIGGREVILRAGEVYENMDGTLTVCDHDESVLIFLDGEAYARQIFNAPVYRPQVAAPSGS